MRRTRARRTGQAWLTEEIEWAPFASFEIPGPVYDRLAQMQLFSHDDDEAQRKPPARSKEAHRGNHEGAAEQPHD
jgi:hypothetical protein